MRNSDDRVRTLRSDYINAFRITRALLDENGGSIEYDYEGETIQVNSVGERIVYSYLVEGSNMSDRWEMRNLPNGEDNCRHRPESVHFPPSYVSTERGTNQVYPISRAEFLVKSRERYRVSALRNASIVRGNSIPPVPITATTLRSPLQSMFEDVLAMRSKSAGDSRKEIRKEMLGI